MKTLLVGEIHQDALELLNKNTKLTEVKEIFYNTEIEAIVLRTYTKLGMEEISKLPKLKYVVSCSVGIDNIDLNLLKERKINLIHTPGSNANSVAEHTLYLITSLLRNCQKPYPELKNKIVGIIGLGYIGKLVAKKLIGFESKVIAFDVIEQDPETIKDLRVEMKPFNEVIKNSDILTIHVPLNKHTKNLINNETFQNMKKKSFFINTSRGEVVDENSLMQHQEKFKGIALDVCSETLSLKGNIIITNHCAAQGEDSLREMCVKPVKTFINYINEQKQ